MKSISETLAHLSFWNSKDIFDMIITLSLGILVCWAGLKSGAFHWHPPIWLTIEGMATLIGERASVISQTGSAFVMSIVKSINRIREDMITHLNLNFRKFDQSKSTTVLGNNLIGISADIGILIFILGLLIVWYTITNPSLM